MTADRNDAEFEQRYSQRGIVQRHDPLGIGGHGDIGARAVGKRLGILRKDRRDGQHGGKAGDEKAIDHEKLSWDLDLTVVR